MEFETTAEQGLTGAIHVRITPEQFPAITGYCRRDAGFQTLIADNLERVVEEYLTAAEAQVAAAQQDKPQ